jgi:hypothetical protein
VLLLRFLPPSENAGVVGGLLEMARDLLKVQQQEFFQERRMLMPTVPLTPTSLNRSRRMPYSQRRAEQSPLQRQLWATGLTKMRAEAVLDWLENHGHCDCQVSYVAGKGFTVMG